VTSTRERILDASFELFRRQGLTGTGVKQILARAEAPYGSLYHHFPGGKDQLAAETIARAGVYYGQLVAGKLAEHDDIVEALRAAFHDAGMTLVQTDFADACPVETVALEVASTNERLRAATAEVFDSWVGAMAAYLTAGGVDPSEARSLALTIVAALEGAFVLARATRRTDVLDACGDAMAKLVQEARQRTAAAPSSMGRSWQG
jgi:AcrR family transcriptional regulator